MKIDTEKINFLANLKADRPQKSLDDKTAARDIKLREQAQEMESLFVAQMIKAMEKTVPDNSITGNKQNIAGMMFSTVFADAISENDALGLSDLIYSHLKTNDRVSLDELKNNILDNPVVLESLKMNQE